MSCLFNSLQYFIKENSYDIRQKICDYLEENKTIIEGIDTKMILEMETPHYIQNMRYPSTWGGAIEIQCACNIWKTTITVKDIRTSNGKTIEFIPVDKDNISDNCIRIDWNGYHYEPIR